MHNHKSLFNMDISGGMPAVIIKMLVASEPGRIELLPALPGQWASGAIEGILCRGQIEVKRLEWAGGQVRAVLVSERDQTVVVQAGETELQVELTAGVEKEIGFSFQVK